MVLIWLFLPVSICLAVQERPSTYESESRVRRKEGGSLADASSCFQLRVEADEALYRGDPSGALALYERAKEIVDRSGCADNAGPVLYGIGRCNFVLNKLSAARDAYLRGRQALENIKKSRSSSQKDYIVYILSDLGTLYTRLGEYAEAEKVAVECLSIVESSQEEARFSVYAISYGKAVSWSTLGNVKAWDGEFESSLVYLEKSFALFREMSKADPTFRIALATELTDIGLLHKAAGDYARALHYLHSAIVLAEREGDMDVLARAVVSLGFLYMDQGDYGAALGYLERGLKQERERGNKVGASVFMMNLGYIKLRQGNRTAASLDFEEALKTIQGLESPSLTISTYDGLGAVYKAEAHYEMAIQSFDKSLEIAKRTGDKARQAEAMWWKGEVFYDQRLDEKALEFAEESCRLSSQAGVPNIVRLALTLKGKALLAQKRYDLASEALSHAIDTIEHMRTKAAGQEQERASFLKASWSHTN